MTKRRSYLSMAEAIRMLAMERVISQGEQFRIMNRLLDRMAHDGLTLNLTNGKLQVVAL